MYRILFLALFVLALAVPAALAQDAAKVDSQHYKVESENSRVRVLRVKYGPHEKSVMHGHPDLVAIFLTDGRVKFTYPGGKTEVREMKAGQTLFTPAVKHLPENLGDSDMDIILVELKTPKTQAGSEETYDQHKHQRKLSCIGAPPPGPPSAGSTAAG